MSRWALFLAIAAPLAWSAEVRIAVDHWRATQPAINDSGEVAYLVDGLIYSSTRGLLVGSPQDPSNLGLANDGEVVYASGSAPGIVSTTRGELVAAPSYGPSISFTSGEVAYIDASDFSMATTLRGIIESFSLGYVVGVGDVNDFGEVVFEVRDLSTPYTRLYSNDRGWLTPEGQDAFQPAINNAGEVVWSGFDSGGRQQIFSNVHGQVTRFGDGQFFTSADLPDINNAGVIAFRARESVAGSDRTAIFVFDPNAPVAVVPLPSAFIGGVALLGVLGMKRRGR